MTEFSILKVSEHFGNETNHNQTVSLDIEEISDYAEMTRIIHVTVRPILIVFGTIGNLLSFYVMRRGSLKNASTCFYMSILALADTGKCILSPFLFIAFHHYYLYVKGLNISIKNNNQMHSIELMGM